MVDNRTLDEIKEDHVDNFDEILKSCKVTNFNRPADAHQFRLHATEKAFRDLGFSPQDFITNATSMDTAVSLIDQAMVSRGIRVEDWSEHHDNDRRGLYLYKDNEIAFFIALGRKRGDNYSVKTNVKFE